jgi:hypothetical protein
LPPLIFFWVGWNGIPAFNFINSQVVVFPVSFGF